MPGARRPAPYATPRRIPAGPTAIEAVWLGLVVLFPAAINRLAVFPYAIDRRLLLHGAGLASVIALLAAAVRRLIVRSPKSEVRSSKSPSERGVARSAGGSPPCASPGSPVSSAIPLFIAGAAFLVIRLASSLFGLCPEVSILGSPVRDGGLLSQLSCAAILGAVVLLGRGIVRFERILVAICIGSAVPVAVGLLQCAGYPILVTETGFPEGRIWSTFGNPILFGSYLIAAIPATLWTLARAAAHPGWPRWKRLLLSVILAVLTALEGFLLVKTGSRGPILGLAAAGAIAALLALKFSGAKNVARALSWAMVAGILLVLGGVQLIARSETVRDQMRHGMMTRFNTVELRLMFYRAMTEQMFARESDAPQSDGFRDARAGLRPWFGYGPDCLSYPILKRLPVRYELAEGMNHIPDSTHSATMDILGGSGILGVLALVGLVAGAVCAAARRGRRWLALAPAIAGAVGMALLWGSHTWALGAVTGCTMGLLLLAGSPCSGTAPSLRAGSAFIAAVAIAAGLWFESQFSVYSASSALLLSLGVAGLVLARPNSAPAAAQPSDESPFGAWCPATLVASVTAFVLLYSLQPQSGGVDVIRGDSAFRAWLDALVRHSAWLHAAIPVATVVLLLAFGRRSAAVSAIALTAVAAAVLAATEWPIIERDMRVACAERVGSGGLPDIARRLLPDEVVKDSGAYATHYMARSRDWLSKQIRSADLKPAERTALARLALAFAKTRAERQPYDAYAQADDAATCVAALETWSDSPQVPGWIDRAERGYRAAVALVPGSNVLRQRLAKVLFVYRHDLPAVQAVFDDMLALEPENPVALSMRGRFALQAAEQRSGSPRANALRTAYLDSERALRSPSLAMNRVDAASVRATRDAARRALEADGIPVPNLPPATVKRVHIEKPVFEDASERHLGQALVGALAACVVSLLLVPPVRYLARRLGWLDIPTARKVHRTPTPLLGGLAIIAAVWTVALAVPAVPLHGPFLSVLGIATALAAVGIVDDRWPLPWQLKIVAQFAAAIALYALGVRVQLAWLPRAANVLLTVFWLVGVTNAVNFLDNMNGLSNGLAAWSSAAVAAIALVCREWDVAAFALALTGACAGFLRGNNPWRGSIFMGDTGSLFLGLTLASLALLLRFPNNENWVTWLCPVLLLAVPVFDMTHVCVARIRRGCNPFSTPGKDHTSHLFERMLGLGRPAAVLAVHALVLLCAVATWIVSFSSPIVAYSVAGFVLAGAVFLRIYFELRFGAGGTEAYRLAESATESKPRTLDT